jgi:hypothetical protein
MIDKLVPRYLNKDDDARLVKSIEMTDALNVRLSADTDGDAGVIKNAFGNSAVPFASGNNWQGLPHALPEDVNKVVGSVTDQKNGIIIFFVWNDENDHSIYMFSTSKGFAELVYRDSVLGFTANGFVKADVINTVTNDILVYFTDGETPPKKLNISRALTGGYSSVITSGTDEQKLEFLTLAKKPPLDPPTYEFFTDTTYDDNNIYESNFQFSYQYVYFDGEYSAISKYTDLAVAPNQYLDGFIEDAQRNEYNAIRVFVETSTADVKTIRVLGRRGNAGPWFIVGEIANPALSSPATLSTEFRNDELYRFISQDEANKIYDAVPLTAQSQTISGSRLFLGNYSEGYPNVRVDSQLLPNYDATPEIYNIPISLDVSGQNKKLNVDVTSIPAGGVSTDSILVINYSFTLGKTRLAALGLFVRYVLLNQDLEKVQGGGLISDESSRAGIVTECDPISIYGNISVSSGTSKSDIIALIEAELQKAYRIQFSNPITSEYGTLLTEAYSVNSNGNQSISGRKYGFFTGVGSFNLTSQGLSGNTLSMLMTVNRVSLSLLNVCDAVGLPQPGNPALSDLFEVDSFEFFPTSSTSGTLNGYVGDGVAYDYYLDTTRDPDTEIISPSNLYTPPSGGATVASSVSIEDSETLESSSFLSDTAIGTKAFKSGASHDLGIVLYDDRGRSSGVQKLGSAYVQDLYQRDNKGAASIVMRLDGEAPSWADRWSPVYIRTGNKYKFLQYSTSNAFIGSNQSAPIQISGYNGDVIYVSMRSLEGKSNSYKESDAANISYEYSEGDRLRVVSYIDPSINTITVSSINGSVNVGDKFTAFAVPPVEFTVTEINVLGGVGTISGTVNGPMGSSALMVNLVNSSTILYSAVSVASGIVYPELPTFSVVGYKFLGEDSDTNPILNPATESTIFNTTGWFLILKNTTASGFDVSSIIQENNFWQKQCLVEIYNKRTPTDQEIYYEIGESYPIQNNTYIGERTVSPLISARCMNAGPLIFYSPTILYVGDIVSDGTNTFLVNNVIEQQNIVSAVTYNYVVQATRQQGSFSINTNYSVSVQNAEDAVVNIEQGDIYYRIRKLKYGHKSQENNAFVSFVEANNVSDFFSSTNTSIGRPFAVLPEAKTIYRTGSVTYSEPFIIDVTRLGLSSFNPSLAPFYDLNYIHGSIRYMVNRDDSIVFLQDKKCGLFPVNRNLIEYVNGQQGVTVSTSVVGTPNYYAGEYGVGNNPESVATEGGRIYFSDIRNGKVIRISQDGITPISETKMDAFFKDAFRDIVRLGTVKTVIGGVDDEAGEYIVTTPRIDTSVVTITDGSTTYTYQLEAAFSSMIWDVTSDIWSTTTQTWSGIVIAGITYDSDLLTTFSTEVRTFDDLCDEFQDSVNAVVFLDLLTSGQPAIVGAEFQGTGQTIYGVATNSSFDFFLPIILNLSSGVFAFLNDCGSFTGTQGPSSESTSGFTVGYDTDNKVWNTRYSYSPERIASLDDTLYTFQNGTMYIHDDTANRSTYYGVAYGSTVEVISNNNPSMVKAYESLSLEGTSPWAVTMTNTDQSTSILSADFDEREREYFAYVPRDTSANTGTATITSLSGSSEMFVLGNVATSGVSGSTITFTTPVGDVAFPIGGALYKVSGSTFVTLNLTVTSISGDKSIDANGVIAGVNDGDTIVVLANAGIEGDQLRDYYAQISLTNSSTSEIELYAVNAVYAKSNLHNELGQ